MNTDSKGEIEELSLEAQELISGGTGEDFGQYVDDNNPLIPEWENHHSKEQPGQLIKR